VNGTPGLFFALHFFVTAVVRRRQGVQAAAGTRVRRRLDPPQATA